MHPEILYIENDGRCEVIALSNLLYVSAGLSETYFFTTNGVVVSPVPLSCFDQYLSRRRFCRIHAAHMISLEKIISFDSQGVLMPGALLPLAGEYEASLRGRLKILEAMEPQDSPLNLYVDPDGRLREQK